MVLITPARTVKRSWLDTRVPRFKCSRATVAAASNLLRMELQIAEKPELAKGGFAGHFRPGDLTDFVGPFDVQNATVRDLLDLIVGSSKGGIWLAIEERAWSEDFGSYPWLIFTYGEPLKTNLERMHFASEGIRSIFAEKAK